MPWILTDEVNLWFTPPQPFVARCNIEEEIMECIVTDEETSVQFHEPENKRHSLEWSHTSCPGRKVVKFEFFVKKSFSFYYVL